MFAIIKMVNEEPSLENITSSSIRFICNGDLEAMDFPGDDNIVIYCNEEYLLNGSMANLMLPEYNNFICDNIVICGFDKEMGTDRSLTNPEIEKVMNYIKKNKLHNVTSGMAFYKLLRSGK